MLEGNIDADLPLNLADDLVDKTYDSYDLDARKELIIAVHIVSNANGSWSKSRKKLEFTILNDDFKIYGGDMGSEDVNIEAPKVDIVDVHSAIIRFFGQEALMTLNAIKSETNTMTESTLIGDDHAKFNVCSKLSTFFKDIV